MPLSKRLFRIFVQLPLFLLIAVSVLSNGCKGTGSGTIKLQGAGATFPNPLYQKWLSEFSKQHPNILIDYQSIGSGGGIKQIQAQTVDFGASDAPMTDAELKGAPGEIVHIPTVLGAVVLTYNLQDVFKAAAIFAGCNCRHLSRKGYEVERSAYQGGQCRCKSAGGRHYRGPSRRSQRHVVRIH